MTARASQRRAALVLIAAVLGVAATARLGIWQLDRAAQKLELQATIDARTKQPPVLQSALATTAAEAALQRYRRTVVHGRWAAESTVFLENRQMNGRVGFYVVTPLVLEDAGVRDAVAVQRGFVPRDVRDRTALPALRSPRGVVEVTALIAPPPARLFEFGADERGSIRQNLELDAYARETGLQLRPFSLQQVTSPDTAGDSIERDWPRPAVDVDKHYGYAFQWFALSALMAGLYVWFQLIRSRLRPRR